METEQTSSQSQSTTSTQSGAAQAQFKNPLLLIIACAAALIAGYAFLQYTDSVEKSTNMQYSNIMGKRKKPLKKAGGQPQQASEVPAPTGNL